MGNVGRCSKWTIIFSVCADVLVLFDFFVSMVGYWYNSIDEEFAQRMFGIGAMLLMAAVICIIVKYIIVKCAVCRIKSGNE